MATMKLIAMAALLSVVSAGHVGNFQPSFGYSTFGANAISSASASAYTSNFGRQIPILRYENINNGDGTYKYNFETGNGISAHESGAHASASASAEGGYSYTGADGQQVVLSYTADGNGFHPIGSHIPTPPPIPEAILRSIEFNKQNPSSGEGSYNSGRYGHSNY